MRNMIILAAILPLAAPALANPKVSPGQWQSTMVIEEFTMPGVPPEVAAMARSRPTTVKYCLTPEEAEANPEKLLAQDNSCKTVRFRFEGGKIDAEMRCETEMGPATMTMQGSYQPESYTMRARTVAGPMTTASRMTAKRIGPCTGGNRSR